MFERLKKKLAKRGSNPLKMSLDPASAGALAATQEKNACLPTSAEQDYITNQFRKDVEGIWVPLHLQHLNFDDILNLQNRLEKIAVKIADLDTMDERRSLFGVWRMSRPSEILSLYDHLIKAGGLPKQNPLKEAALKQSLYASCHAKFALSKVWLINMYDIFARPLIDCTMRNCLIIIAFIDYILNEKLASATLGAPVTINPSTGQHKVGLQEISDDTILDPSEVIAEIDRILEERNMYAEIRPMLLDRSITVAINPSPGQSAQYIASRTLSDYLSAHTLDKGLGGWHIDRLGQGLSHLGGIHLYRNRLPRRKASLLRTLLLASFAGILVAGAHLPRSVRTITGVLSLSADVANIPMHMRTDYPALRWSLLAFCLIACAAFVGSLWYTLKGPEQRHQAYLFYAIFTGVGAIGTTLVADKVGDTVNSVLAFGPLALTLIAGLFYMPFRYGFSVGAHQVVDVEMQAQPGR